MNDSALRIEKFPAETATSTLDLSGESPGQAVPVFDGVWIIATRHRPGLSRHMFEINNRCFVFRVFDQRAAKPTLVVVNAVDPTDAIPEVKRVERETGLQVTAIISPGGGHHLHISPWHAAFEHAKILLCPVRTPRTRNGEQLMRLPRVDVLNLENPLPELRGQLDAVVFHGLVGPPDDPTPVEGGKDTKLAFLAGMVKFMITRLRDPADELWLHHVPSQTVIGGENLTWYFRADQLRGAPLLLKGMVKPDTVSVFTAARRVADREAVARCWRKILAWPCRTLMTYHDLPGTAFIGDGRAALARAVEKVGQLA